jgi:hypothetical protein
MSSTLFEAFLAKIYVDAKARTSFCLIHWAKRNELD